MQETWDFKIESENRIEEHDKIIKRILQSKQNEMGIFLSYYFKQDGAVVENVVLRDDLLFNGKYKGKFTVEFDLIFYNACLNIHDQNKDKLEIEFELDQNLGNLKLLGPLFPERGQDEI